MSIGGGHPDDSGRELVDSCVMSQIRNGGMNAQHVARLNEIFSLGLGEDVIANVGANVELIRGKLFAVFNFGGDCHDAMGRFNTLIDFLEEFRGVPAHERRPVVETAARIKRKISRRFEGTMVWVQLDGADLSHPDNREPIRQISREIGIRVKKEEGILDECGNVIPGMEALNMAVGG